jgi:hypothetical protein
VKRPRFYAHVEDVYIVQNYIKWLDDYIDRDIGKLHKEIDTQHQWKFEAVEPDAKFFPLGVKTAYRAYSSSKVVEFRKVPKDQALHEVGQATGLDPYTLYCTWQPEAYGINSQEGRHGVEGTYLLKAFPSDIIPISDFVDQSQEYITVFMQRIRKAYSIDCKADIRNEWEFWYENIAPRLQPDRHGNDTIEESTEEYVERLNRSKFPEIRALVKFPLQGQGPILVDPLVFNRNRKWDITAETNDIFDSSFKWPEQLAAAMNSVETSLNKRPQPARMSALSDENLIAARKRFFIDVDGYYKTLYDGTKDKLLSTLSRLVSYSGELFTISSNGKALLLSKTKQWSRSFFATIFKPVNQTMALSIDIILTRELQPREEKKIVKKVESDYLGSKKLSYADIRKYYRNSDVTEKAYDAFLILLSNRNSRVWRSHHDVNSRTDGFVSRKRSIFFPSNFFEGVEDSILHSVDVCKILNDEKKFTKEAYHRFYFTIKLSDYETGILVLDLVEEKVFMLSPHRNKLLDLNTYKIGFEISIQYIVQYINVLTEGAFDPENFPVEVFPHQYFEENESNFPAKLEVLLSLYFMEVDVPIWMLRNEPLEVIVKQLDVIKKNFGSYLILGELPM